MIYDKLMTGQEKRHALVMTKKEDGGYSTYLFDRDNTPMITNKPMYFLPMKRGEMSNTPTLEQTTAKSNLLVHVLVTNRRHFERFTYFSFRMASISSPFIDK